MSLRLVSFLASRLSSQFMSRVTSVSICHASRDAKVWKGQSYDRAANHRPRQRDELFEDDSQMEDVEDRLQAIVTQERRKQKTLKYHKVKRHMTPKGAPERKLTWDAMEQIRYLKQAEPEEWTVERLAEGFSVSSDVIRRILQSKFTAPPERKVKQDASVLAKVHQQALSVGIKPGQGRLQLPAGSPAMLPAGAASVAMVTLASSSLTACDDGPRSPATGSGTALASVPTQNRGSLTVFSKHTSVTELPRANKEGMVDNVVEDDDDEEEVWDGVVFTEEQLEELMMSPKSCPVTQDGNEFFDSDGNFLYRI
ncbi:neugrin [Osmerus mordax]|uniref:neugrin n=1 Tax=Osmerus mordax TaxID=8014 RepID=UPI00350F821F